ncbi:hypothetical protein DACRYDRAFT_113011 [Dacryopinax primogenitus]|uniref:Uncharacterized protein n=1 Tax=Dacryopinax primogenitus (strain DJM 731) TaxID=1858805 RepID=M5GCL2_DACPD|nr:uncharacterized protein DACRYDRAFT_113011 [Dacryopinax primogenitus]EJU06280.1 hypothetical protein DACRYDRAFT_113011 [Dacryopinax primogenitus]
MSPIRQYQQKLEGSGYEVEIDLGQLEFSISRDTPFNMSFSHRGSDLVYKATRVARGCCITCTTHGRTREVARLYRSKDDGEYIKVKFSEQQAQSLEDFLLVVKPRSMMYRIDIDEEIYASFSKDHFTLTDASGTALAYDTRVPMGLFRERIPAIFHISIDLLDTMDYIFVAYICMERWRREGTTSLQSRGYSQAWQNTPGLLCFEGPWGEVM